MIKNHKKNAFTKEVEKRYGKDDFLMQAFITGREKMRVKKSQIKDNYHITLEEFAFQAELAGYKVLKELNSHSDVLIIFK